VSWNGVGSCRAISTSDCVRVAAVSRVCWLLVVPGAFSALAAGRARPGADGAPTPGEILANRLGLAILALLAAGLPAALYRFARNRPQARASQTKPPAGR
jgi:hypothetical protein